MNIETLSDYIFTYEELVVDSGFRRDLTDLKTSVPNIDNIVGLRDTAKNVLSTLDVIHASDLPEYLQKLLPSKKLVPFTTKNYYQQIKDLLDDKTIQQDAFHSKLTAIVSNLHADIEANSEAIEKIDTFIQPYSSNKVEEITDAQKAIVSIIFKDVKTITSFDEFSKNLVAWNRTLPLYHQLITHTSPEKIEIVEVQNGSIDIVISLDVKVALSLGELFTIGFTAYAAYLAQKKLHIPMANAYFGNKKLLELDEQKEKVMLENIQISVLSRAEEQHKDSKGKGAKVDNPTKVQEMVANLVTAHIVRGNDVKILALPTSESVEKTLEGKTLENEKEELKKASLDARIALKGIPPDAIKLLLETYGNVESNSESKTEK